MISGEYSHTLDAKNRVTLPSKLREQLGGAVVMTKSVDKCILLYPIDSWTEYTDRLEKLPETETRRVKRYIYSSAFETSVDVHGRVLIAQNLCDYAELKKNITIIGMGNHVEIWDEDEWKREMNAENADEIASLLIKLGF